MGKNEFVSVIIVSWNGLHWLKKNLKTFEKVTYKNYEIILVDNASTDGTVEWVKQRYPNVRILKLLKNEGFAEANNRGFEISKGKFVLFLNNDVEVTPSFISELVVVLNGNASIGGVQSKLLLLSDKNRLDSIGAFLTSTGFLYHYGFMNIDNEKLNRQINLFTPKGASMMFKKNVLLEVMIENNLFDREAFAYYEETDLAHRIWLHGKRIVYAPKSVVYHAMGGTSTKIENSFIQYHSFKNRIASFIKNISLEKLLPLLFFHLIAVQIFVFISVLKRKWNVAFAIEKALFWNVAFLPHTLAKRQVIQRAIRVQSDDFFWKEIYRTPPLRYYWAQMQGVPYEEPVPSENNL